MRGLTDTEFYLLHRRMTNQPYEVTPAEQRSAGEALFQRGLFTKGPPVFEGSAYSYVITELGRLAYRLELAVRGGKVAV